MISQKQKSEHTEMEYLNNTLQTKILKVKKSLLEFDRTAVIPKLINISVEDMGRFQKKECWRGNRLEETLDMIGD